MHTFSASPHVFHPAICTPTHPHPMFSIPPGTPSHPHPIFSISLTHLLKLTPCFPSRYMHTFSASPRVFHPVICTPSHPHPIFSISRHTFSASPRVFHPAICTPSQLHPVFSIPPGTPTHPTHPMFSITLVI